jgi:uncharacterized YigZ family protein
MRNDNYKEITTAKIGIYKEKGSKFISYAFPTYSKEQVKKRLEEVKLLEHTAQHYCYAYILHSDKSAQRTNDDGEPSSTAGKPILGQIMSNNLTNTLIIVARYFGGNKLGVPGLIHAYKTAAADAISKTLFTIKTIKKEYEVSFKYPQMNDVMRIIKEHNLELICTDFKIECKLIFTVSINKADAIIKSLQRNHELTIKYIKTI